MLCEDAQKRLPVTLNWERQREVMAFTMTTSNALIATHPDQKVPSEGGDGRGGSPLLRGIPSIYGSKTG